MYISVVPLWNKSSSVSDVPMWAEFCSCGWRRSPKKSPWHWQQVINACFFCRMLFITPHLYRFFLDLPNYRLHQQLQQDARYTSLALFGHRWKLEYIQQLITFMYISFVPLWNKSSLVSDVPMWMQIQDIQLFTFRSQDVSTLSLVLSQCRGAAAVQRACSGECTGPTLVAVFTKLFWICAYSLKYRFALVLMFFLQKNCQIQGKSMPNFRFVQETFMGISCSEFLPLPPNKCLSLHHLNFQHCFRGLYSD